MSNEAAAGLKTILDSFSAGASLPATLDPAELSPLADLCIENSLYSKVMGLHASTTADRQITDYCPQPGGVINIRAWLNAEASRETTIDYATIPGPRGAIYVSAWRLEITDILSREAAQ